MTNLSQQISQALAENPHLGTLDLAKQFAVPEGSVIKALPSEFVTVLPGSKTKEVLEDLPTWGSFTTIIEKVGSIFEVKGDFPHAVEGHGYYNLNMGPQSDSSIALSGHLKLEHVNNIALVSKPFRGKESYCFAFIAESGEVIFKVYLGRDEKRRLLPEQVERFKTLIEANKYNF